MKGLVAIWRTAGVNPSIWVRRFASGSTSSSGTSGKATRSETNTDLFNVPV
jgi:hypothetical protein